MRAVLIQKFGLAPCGVMNRAAANPSRCARSITDEGKTSGRGTAGDRKFCGAAELPKDHSPMTRRPGATGREGNRIGVEG
jgi:hypothetical protein